MMESEVTYFGRTRQGGKMRVAQQGETADTTGTVLFHLFRFVLLSSIAARSRPVFFYQRRAGITDPFHHGSSLFRSLFGNICFACFPALSLSPNRVLKRGFGWDAGCC